MKCSACEHLNVAALSHCARCGQALRADADPAADRDAEAPRQVDTGASPSLRPYTPRYPDSELIDRSTAIEGERKVVTVLFCDIANSTAMAEQIGPEAMHGVLKRFLELALAHVHRYEGTINQFLGDGFMALFGAPLAHEDHAQRATAAALSLQEALGAFRNGTTTDPKTQLAARFGIHTGPVIVGLIGDELRMDYTAVGGTTNLAARIQQLAPPSTIYLSRATYDVVQDYVECEPVRARRVKGISQAVEIYRALQVRSNAAAADTARKRRFRSDLVGRNDELELLHDRIERLRDGSGARIRIVGEPGVGKSRLMAEFQSRARELQVAWFEGRALPNTDTHGYWPFVQVLRSMFGISEHDVDETAWSKLESLIGELFPGQQAEVAPYLGRLINLCDPERYRVRLNYQDGEAIRGQIYRALRRFFERYARVRPFILIFEDWHWADQTSREVLLHLLPLFETLPLLCCVVGRPELLRGPDIAGAYPYQTVSLRPLARADGGRLLDNLLGGEIAVELRELLLDRAGGNPFFLEELARALRDFGALKHDSATGAWRLAMAIDEIPLPGSLEGVLMARIDRLPEDVKKTFKIAAVVGRRFSHAIVQQLAGSGGRRIDADVEQLIALELIRTETDIGPRDYAFSHALVQEVTYNSILSERRRELHKLVADAIESTFADRLQDFYSLLAFHYARAESWHKAQEYLFKAGDHAGRVAADVESLRHYNHALVAYARVFGEHWETLQRSTLYRKIGEALFRRGDHHQALDYLRQALAVLGSPYPNSRWGVRLGIIKQLTVQLLRRGAAWLRWSRPAALPSGEASPRREEESRIYDALGWITYFVDQELFALGVLRHLNSSEQSGVVSGRVSSSMAFGVILDQVPLLGISGRYHRRGMSLAERTNHPVALAFAHFGFGLHEHHARGNFRVALDHYHAAAAAYAELGDFRRWGCSMYFAAWVLRNLGDITRALEINAELIRSGQDAADVHVRGWGLQGQARTLWQIGRTDLAISHLHQANELFESIPDYQLVVCAKGVLGQCLLQKGDHANALTLLKQTRELIASRRFRGPFCGEAHVAYAQACVDLVEHTIAADERVAQLRRARVACQVALRQAQLTPESIPAACRTQGTLEWLQGRRPNARRWWQKGVAVATRQTVQFELARLYLEMGRRDDNDDYQTRAHDIFSVLTAQAGEAHRSADGRAA